MTEEPELVMCEVCGKEVDIFEIQSLEYHYPTCIPCVRASVKHWHENHRDVARDTCARRRAAKLTPVAENIKRQLVFHRDNGICHLCLLPVDKNKWHLDHVIPISRGGTHTYDNVKVTHPDCNMRKGAGEFQEQCNLHGSVLV